MNFLQLMFSCAQFVVSGETKAVQVPAMVVNAEDLKTILYKTTRSEESGDLPG